MANFESFSEDLVPRITPRPTLVPALNISKPTVPEVSIIFDDTTSKAVQPKSYKEWRDKQRTQVAQVNPNVQTAIGAKNKFVKFDCVDQSGEELPRQNIPTHSAVPLPFIDANMRKLNAVGSSDSESRNVNGNVVNRQDDAQQNLQAIRTSREAQAPAATIRKTMTATTTTETVPSMPRSSVTVEDMYKLMATHQKRMEANKSQSPPIAQAPQPPPLAPIQNEINLNDIFQLMLQMQQSQPAPQPMNAAPVVPKENSPVAVATVAPTESTRPEDSEPSLKDLMHIIVKQQEQLISIQKQVQVILMQTTNRPLCNEPQRTICDAYNQFNASPNPMGVMTSFEINVQKYSHNKKSAPDRKLRPSLDDGGQPEARLQCCTNCRSPLTQVAPKDMNVVNGSPGVQQSSPDSNQNCPNDWSFYGNILNQVNHVLQNSPPVNAEPNRMPRHEQLIANHNRMGSSSSSPSSAPSSPDCDQFGPAPSHIRTTQFQQIGLKFDDVNVSATTKRVTFDATTAGVKGGASQPSAFNQSTTTTTTTTDKSVIMNALATKYLPFEQRRQSAPSYASPTTANQVTLTQQTTTTAAMAAYSPTIPSNRNHRGMNSPSDMSITSYRYMEKYGLL